MAIGFNEDLTTEILLRLPVKSILKFKTVSKLWLSIASSPQFRQIHASRIVNPTGFFCREDFAPSPKDFAPIPKLEFFTLDSQILPNSFPFFDYPINLISSSGGLLLLLSRHCQSFDLQLKRVRDYFVCNPTTNEFKQLAAVPQLITDAILVSETLAFDPCKSPHYKIVFLFKYHELDKEFKIMIYSSETQTFSSPLATTLDNFRFVGVYCNDAIHWISFKEICCIVYYFDLKRECMKESPLPPNLFEFSHYFGESQGHLHLVTSAEPPEISLLEVHELKSDYSGWSLKYKVNLASMPNTFPKGEMYSAISNGQFAVYSIFVDKGDEENMIMVFLVYGVFVAAYLKYKLYIRLMRDDLHLSMLGSDYYHDLLINGWPVAHQYIETLACVDPPKTQVTCSNKKKIVLRKRRRFW